MDIKITSTGLAAQLKRYAPTGERNNMSVTILECLQNADYNLSNNGSIGATLAKGQLHNATVLLEAGYDVYDEVEPLLEKYGDVESVPEKQA